MIQVTLTNKESNVLAAANYAYRATYATPEDLPLFKSFDGRADAAIQALPEGAEEVTLDVTDEEELLLLRSVSRVVATVPLMEVLGVMPPGLIETLDSLMTKFVAAHGSGEEVPEGGAA